MRRGWVVRITLIAPAVNAALRQVRFDDAPPDAAGLRRAAAAATSLPHHDMAFTAPSERCRGTAEALGLGAAVTPELRDLDVGRWRGRSLDEVGQEAPEEVAGWLSDPAAAPHGGETLLELVERIGAWLEARREDPAPPVPAPESPPPAAPPAPARAARLLAVVEPAVVRAALVHALGLPAPAFWRLDVAPLTATELSGRAGRWNLRCGYPLVGSAP
ncbi:histidine phosphatase family protein [Streptomyces rugosispiralis]|uniref:Histidine phosphatase family protein n=1 Tax=Streptomyces rugosispiralis TaxID=2967341 RepID=A0ABT1UQB6_9ACTN|nr:histidine phosphatase family protein [Streptomyces rugosispiralis]MCQ8187313.1 histidine phosphatase family protein [Streptomyces rugosispiralis]